MRAKFEMQGTKELVEVLKKLPADMQKRILMQAVRAGGQILRKEMIANVPAESGRLRKSIAIERMKIRRSNDDGAHIVVGISSKNDDKENKRWPQVYGRMLEFGTSKMAARPWARPAFEKVREQIIQLWIKKLSEGIEQSAARLRGPISQSGLLKKRRR